MTAAPPTGCQPDTNELLALADEYEAGLKKMEVSGYEEFDGPRRTHRIVIDALRAQARAAPVPQRDAVNATVPHAKPKEVEGGWRVDVDWLAKMQADVEKATGYGVTLECVEEIVLRTEAGREALEFYAQNYCEGWCKDSSSSASFEDCGGCRARLALSPDHGTVAVTSAKRATPSDSRVAERLADVVMMLDTPDAYNREYIAAVCRSILSSVTSTNGKTP